jgi:hypothetical protein
LADPGDHRVLKAELSRRRWYEHVRRRDIGTVQDLEVYFMQMDRMSIREIVELPNLSISGVDNLGDREIPRMRRRCSTSRIAGAQSALKQAKLSGAARRIGEVGSVGE